jgi:3-isopropylmalate/(R)-2-methylmalate dehydratase small subunit
MNTQPFTQVSGIAAPLMTANIDTDVIIRIERLADMSRDNLGKYAFEALRYSPEGTENPGFILNQEGFRGSPILIAGANFGCGSSREGAVSAILALGIRCVISSSFGDIFYGNCFQNGLLPAIVGEDDIASLAREAMSSRKPTTVDLVRRIVISPEGVEMPFAIDALRRQALLEGLDDIGLTLKSSSEIDAWQAEDRKRRPWIWSLPGRGEGSRKSEAEEGLV